MMLAFWMWAVVLWMEGFEAKRPAWLISAVVLVALAELTKYFGVALIPLLAAYSFQRERRWGKWAWYLLFPFAVLAGFELWSKLQYGHGLVSGASSFARSYRAHEKASRMAKLLEALSFTGGCVLPGFIFAPFLWSRWKILLGGALSILGGVALSRGWRSLGFGLVPRDFHRHWMLVAVELALFIAGGISVAGLGLAAVRQAGDPERLILMLWLGGTFVFTAWVNWIANARSVLPLIPAAAILLVQRLESRPLASWRTFRPILGVGLGAAAVVAFWVGMADERLANASRRAAQIVSQETAGESATIWLGGHSGFQYYMQLAGAKPIDLIQPELKAGDFVALPENSVRLFDIRKEVVASRDRIVVPVDARVTTASADLGAGFYSDYGPLPYVFGPVPPERCYLLRLKSGGHLDAKPW